VEGGEGEKKKLIVIWRVTLSGKEEAAYGDYGCARRNERGGVNHPLLLRCTESDPFSMSRHPGRMRGRGRGLELRDMDSRSKEERGAGPMDLELGHSLRKRWVARRVTSSGNIRKKREKKPSADIHIIGGISSEGGGMRTYTRRVRAPAQPR